MLAEEGLFGAHVAFCKAQAVPGVLSLVPEGKEHFYDIIITVDEENVRDEWNHTIMT
ncbi:unnamed protein product [Amoebophrya sp. A25]|nr:unnamed protein product [Amoebophrya sp. A25]|eukprot:GSA25T00012006001.1